MKNWRTSAVRPFIQSHTLVRKNASTWAFQVTIFRLVMWEQRHAQHSGNAWWCYRIRCLETHSRQPSAFFIVPIGTCSVLNRCQRKVKIQMLKKQNPKEWDAELGMWLSLKRACHKCTDPWVPSPALLNNNNKNRHRGCILGSPAWGKWQRVNRKFKAILGYSGCSRSAWAA